jgi:hypothetical protein
VWAESGRKNILAALTHCLLGSSPGTSAKQTGQTLFMLSHLVTQLAWYTCLQGSVICRFPLLYSIWQITHLSRRVFFLEKKPHLYLVTGSNEMRSWERPRLWVPTASPKSNNSCQEKAFSIPRTKDNQIRKEHTGFHL